MKHYLRKALLVLFGGVFMSTAAWAETIESMGAVDKGWGTSGSYKDYTLAANQSMTMSFTVSSVRGAETTDGHFIALNQDGSAVMYLQCNGGFMNGTWWNWDGNDSFTCNWWNETDGFVDFWKEKKLEGATVELTIARYGVYVCYNAIISTTANGTRYLRQVVHSFDADKDVLVSLGADYAVLTGITVNDPVNTIQGTLIGDFPDTSDVWGSSNYFGLTIPTNSSFTFKFNQYSDMLEWYNGAEVELLIDPISGDRWGWAGIRPDRWGWAGGNFSDFTTAIGDYFTISSTSGDFFKDFPYCLNNAEVEMTIARNGRTFSITSVTTCNTGEVKTQVFTYTNDVFANENYIVTANLRANKSHLDLLPVTAAINEYGWATFVSDFDLDFSKAQTGLAAYAVTGHEASAITKDAVTSIVPAGTPLLLNGDASTDYTIPVSLTTGTAPATNLLKAGTGASVAPETGKTKYALSVEGGVACFKKITSAREIPAGKAYLEFNETIEAREFFALDEETTGVADVRVKMADGRSEYFNLAGQRVAQPTRGLYIVNGRKVLVP